LSESALTGGSKAVGDASTNRDRCCRGGRECPRATGSPRRLVPPSSGSQDRRPSPPSTPSRPLKFSETKQACVHLSIRKILAGQQEQAQLTDSASACPSPAARRLALQPIPQLGNICGLNRLRRVAPRIADIGQHICNLLVAEIPAKGRHRWGGRGGRSGTGAAADQHDADQR